MEVFLFIIFSILSIGGGILAITQKNPLACAISLAVTFLANAGFYTLLSASLVAVMQVLVYAGAIMVLVIFVIMLLNLPEEEYEQEKITVPRIILGVVIGVPLLIVFFKTLGQLDLKPIGAPPDPDNYGSIESVGKLLFTQYIYPFEIISVLLLVAIVGAVILAKRHLD